MVSTREQCATDYEVNEQILELVKAKYSERILKEILCYARANPDREIGGYIYEHNGLQLFEPIANVASNPEAQLEHQQEVEILEQIFKYQSQHGLAFVHSHVQHQHGTFAPSPRDLQQVAVDVLDWIIVNTATGEFIFIGGHNDYSEAHGLIGAQVLLRV